MKFSKEKALKELCGYLCFCHDHADQGRKRAGLYRSPRAACARGCFFRRNGVIGANALNPRQFALRWAYGALARGMDRPTARKVHQKEYDLSEGLSGWAAPFMMPDQAQHRALFCFQTQQNQGNAEKSQYAQAPVAGIIKGTGAGQVRKPVRYRLRNTPWEE